MNHYTQWECLACYGHRKIIIGRNIDDKQESTEHCPLCKGKGWLEVYNAQPYGKPHSRLKW